MGLVNAGVTELVFEFTNNFLLKFSIPVKSPQNIEIIQLSTINDIIYMNFNVNCLFQGLPLVVMFVQEEGMDKKELARLQEEGQNLADKWVFSVFFISLDGNFATDVTNMLTYPKVVKIVNIRQIFLNLPKLIQS